MGQELFDLAGWSRGQSGKHVAEVGEGVDAVKALREEPMMRYRP